MRLREYSIAIHSILIILFIYHHSQSYLLMLAAPCLHLMIILRSSACYKGHCHIEVQRRFKEERLCDVCELDEWIRMRHCYKCNQCVHKFDHHCVLMGVCIGEFNHKHYVLFLYCYLVNTFLLVRAFHLHILGEVTLDEKGVEHLSLKYYFEAVILILLYFNSFLAVYLTFFHTIFMFNNITTWEKAKRDSIWYLKNVNHDIKYPFSLGYAENLRQFFGTDSERPI